MPLSYKSLISRLTGISTPIGGITWNPTKAEVDIAKELLFYLEDRRFLYTPFESEDYRYVVDSVLQTRKKLSTLIPDTDNASVLNQSIVSMRAACRIFLDKVKSSESQTVQLGFSFILALGELRAQFGLAIARFSLAYCLNLPDALVDILPSQPTREDKKSS